LARAKRTDRTEARRRTRAEQAAVTSEAAALATAGVTSAGSTAGSRAGQPGQPARPSISAAFRGSFRQVHVADDLRALPRLLIHWSFWGPALATIVTTIVYIYASQGRTADTPQDMMWVGVNLAFQMFVFPLPAPAGSAFIAGFGSKRASWLIGLILGVLSAACFAIVLQSVSATLTQTSPGVDLQALALQGLLVAPIGASLFASAAAWYRRFLNMANPNRSQRKAQPAKPQQGRGDIKRDRLSH
jgi:hypothetical protein